MYKRQADTLLQGALIQGALAIGHHASLGVDEIGGGNGYHPIACGGLLLGVEVNGEGIPLLFNIGFGRIYGFPA